MVPVAKDSNDSGNVSERELVGSAKAFGPIGMRPGEIPGVLHSNNHSMYEGQSCRNKGWSGKRVIQEEHALEKGVGNLAEGSYRGEQVDLSFSTRNRKGPANHSPAPSSRDPKSGIPPRYFESPLATQEQQSLLRAQNLQKENNNSARRVRSSSQGNYRGARYLSLESTSETSNMGSEFDAADTEVKWFADQAFRGLSSPQVDYLDVYSSSRESSTNVSQPSTVDSPGSATWISYADLHDSLHENDNALCHTAAFLPSGTLNPAKCFDMGSFECVDVAVESKEETKRGKKTVPKRQIQFKRRNIDESGVKAMDSLSTETCARETFVRQHSTPASMQEDLAKGNHEIQTGKKMLQKSASLDECSPKSKIASTVIKSVLSKKMDTATNESLKSEPCEDKKKYNETLSVMELSNAERPSSRVPSEYSLSSEDFAGNEERSPHPSRRKYWPPKVPPKPFFKPNSIPSNNNPAGVVFQDIPFVNDQIKPIMVDAIKSKISKQQGSTEKEASKLGETFSSESGSASNRAPNCTAVCVASTLSSVNNHRMTPETCKQQESSNSMFLSKTPEITLKPCAIKDKNKSSTKAFVCPEPQTSKDTLCEPQLEETIKEQMSFKPGLESENEEDIEKSKAKSVIHKVRDVRKLVKNTYNLSFKASNTTHVEDVQEKMQPENPHPLQIECKAISWKDKTSSCSKSTTQQDVEEMSNKSKHSQMDSPQENDVCITKITAETSLPNVQYSDMDFLDKCSKVSKSGNSERPAQLETPPRPSSKEISTLVFLQDSTPKSTQKPTIPASPSAKIANNSHSVSMLRKEKGMQADIGVCDVLSEGAGAKPKHINRLEVPLQTYASGETSSELQKGEKEVVDSSPEQKTSLNNGLQTSRGILQVRSSPKPKEVKILPTGKAGVNQSQPANEQEVTFATESKAEVRTISNKAKVHAMAITTSKEIELPIQVRSISSDRPKPSVLPKPNYKQPFAEIRSTSADITPTSFLKEQTNLKSDVKIIETSATVIHNEPSDNTASSHTKTLAVSAVSSHKPQTTPLTTMSSSVQKSTASTSRQEVSITSIQNSSNQQQENNQEQMIPASLYQTSPVVSQTDTNMQHAIRTSTNDDFRFPTSDDPPSYDERESFSPLHVSDLPPRRQNRYHPTTKHSVCSCTSCAQPQFGHPYHSSQNQTPPIPHSPGQVISYPGAPPQAQVRPHKCRPDGQPLNYTSVSPKTAVQQSPAMVQPMHHSHTCPAPGIQLYGNEQQQSSTQHMERRSGNQRSPQAPSGATYREHSRSPSIAALDTRSHFFNPQELPPAFGNEYGSDGSGNGGMLYPENASGLGYGQGPRRVLLDPETGKYFYIEVPMQPLRKMLFDPEIGQYVEVLIPQQAMSNSSMYPPTSAPYQGPYHGQGLYASQYLPYSMPPHPQSAQQPRHPEPSVPTSLHQNTMGYGSSASQAPKSDVKGHPSLDQSYLESMYYIPTGINASPNSTPSDCYHKPATNMPAAGGRRA
ncbi:cardiac-enriched FHL2-interacting protein [Silurus meridionalis]|uniref:cardiac-enriched FHL2-interacting protein n=1 Tax=Silurus meridionalis TaxID=175797 RepID=UPI001EEC6649|nr:cardiac-enriched FHL2-interacting protein [Silurus meridionalis]